MALQGKFVVNNEEFSPLVIFGVGSFMAFSGQGAYRNQSGCGYIRGNGPIPAGRYWVVDRPVGGIRSQALAWVYDFAAGSNRSEWFALYRDDGMIDDYTWVSGVNRGNFRLHPGTISEGCITLSQYSDFQSVRNASLRTSTVLVRNTGLRAYAMIEVIDSSSICRVVK
ncbi:DUF2778 domain-containing protein [Pseudomonas akapageensis]|uniref:DUF2778 domain-containing protein n=1 Tax=Pseudomonas akapageensis TaxID=2609961 RepID=UPI0014073E8C|nr:DUF2778 domain-containing protein [Pseudomonas akapageensis]